MPKEAKEARPGRQMLLASDSFVLRWEGADRTFIKWETRIWSDHPMVKGREHLFEPIQAHYPDVEAATAAPGEVRS